MAAACAGLGLEATIHEQPKPIGMLDAVLRPLEALRREPPACVWITWYDQIGIRPETLARLAEAPCGGGATLTLPTCRKARPYIHLDRDGAGHVHYVRHRREGDAMPAEGEADAGLFALGAAAYLDELPRYAAAPDAAGATTGERNFLPFLPWIERAGHVATFPCLDPEEDDRRQHAGRRRRRRGLSRPPMIPITLSVVIPAYNEARFIGTLLDHIQAVDLAGTGVTAELIVVDDGSSDDTADIAGRYGGVRVIRQRPNAGKGAAVRAGIAAATGTHVLIQDADLEYDPQDYLPMLAALRAGGERTVV